MFCILLLIKISLQDNEFFKPTTIPAGYPTESIAPFSFLDYVAAINAPKACVEKSESIDRFDFEGDVKNLDYSISGINILDWPVPFVKCNSANCENAGDDASDFCETNILALSPTDANDINRVNDFKDYIFTTYPMIKDFQHYDIVQIFDDSDAIDEYVKDEMYGVVNSEVSKPKIAVAVVIGGSEKEYEYAIRTNSTGWNSGELGGRPVMMTQPSTKTEFNAFARKANEACPLEPGTVNIGGFNNNNCNVQYMYNGALTIQRLVGDFIISTSGSGYNVAENGVSFADFPSKEYVQDGFYAVVSPYVPLLLVLGLLFPFASMVRGIVQEKEMRQKELMKMMSVSEVSCSSRYISINRESIVCQSEFG